MAVPNKTMAATLNFETIPMVAVSDTGIQDALHLILVQRCGLEAISQGVAVRADSGLGCGRESFTAS